MARALAAAVLLLTLCPAARASGPDEDAAAYRAVVERYRTGGSAAAIRALSDWDVERLGKAARQVAELKAGARERTGWDAPTLSAACLMHVEALLAGDSRPAFRRVNLTAAQDYVARLRRLKPLPPLAADLNLAVALWLQGQLRFADLRAFFEDTGDRFASNAGWLLAQATMQETLAARRLERARRAFLVPAAGDSLAAAERLLRRALELEPRLSEARIRLGHVLLLEGQGQAAVAMLQPMTEASNQPPTRYLAHLFIGAAHSAAGRLTEAQAAFAASAAAYPCGQTAPLALLQAAVRGGAGREAAHSRMMESLQPVSGCTDPWSVYDFGQAPYLPGFLAALRQGLTP